MAKVKPMLGKRFWKLTVIEQAQFEKNGNALWICKCDCGNVTQPIRGSSLRNGNTKSCGCLNNKHNKTGTRLYNIWKEMRHRCRNSACERYGGRGIKVCDEWNSDFTSFYKWSIENGYESHLSIDRIDVNGNYEPSNCRWVTTKSQANNKENTIKVSINGNEKTLQQLSVETGIMYRTLYDRYKSGLRGNELTKEVKKRG